MIKQDRGTPYSVTGTGGTTTTVIQNGAVNQIIYVSDVTASCSAGTATVVIKSESTTIWNDIISSTVPYELHLVSPVACASGATLSVVVTGLTATSTYANASGFINNVS